MSSKPRPRPASPPAAGWSETGRHVPQAQARVLVLGVRRVARRCSCCRRVFADLLPLKDPDATFRGVARDGPAARALVRRRQHRPRRVQPDDLRRPPLARSSAPWRPSSGCWSAAPSGSISGFYRRTPRRRDRAPCSTSCWPSPASSCCSRSSRSSPRPAPSSPTEADVLGHDRPVDPRHPGDRPRHPGPDDGVGRPRLRDGVAHARAPATSGSSLREIFPNVVPTLRLVRLHARSPC